MAQEKMSLSQLPIHSLTTLHADFISAQANHRYHPLTAMQRELLGPFLGVFDPFDNLFFGYFELLSSCLPKLITDLIP